MADITAKRGPIDPNDYVTNQGVATQAQLKGLDRDIRYHENQPSTWDRVMGGIKDVMKVGESALSMANSYKDLDVKDEAIEASKLNRQKTELDMEKTRQTMKYQAIKNDLALTEYRKNNTFVTDYANAIAAQDYTKAIQLVLSDPNTASKNSGMLFYTADNLEALGYSDEASQLRMVASKNLSVDQLKTFYAMESGRNSEKTAQQLENLVYSDKADIFQELVLKNVNNTTAGISDNPNLTKQGHFSDYVLTNCKITDGASQEQMDNYKQLLSSIPNKNGETSGGQSLLQSADNKKSSTDNLKFATISCKDPNNPKEWITTTVTYNANQEVSLPDRDKNGNKTGKSHKVKLGNVVSDIISGQETARQARNKLLNKTSVNAPNTTPNTTPNEDATKGEKTNTTKVKFSELPKTTQEIITNDNKKSFDEYQKDMREEITKNSVPDEQGNTVIGKDIVNWGLEDLKDKVVKILQKDPETANVANKVAEQEVWVAANKAGNYFVVNDIAPNTQQKVEQTAYILSEKYPELNFSENKSTETEQETVDETEQDYKNPFEESKETGKSLYQIAKERKEKSKKELQNRFKSDEPTQINKDLYDTFIYHKSLLSTPMSMNTIYNNSIKSLKDSGQDVSISKSKIEQAIGKSIQKVMFNNYAGKEMGGEKINSAKDFPILQKYSVGNKLSNQIFEVLKTDYPEIYNLLIKGINYNSEKSKQEREKKELRKNFNF